jgi:hypothetical protein
MRYFFLLLLLTGGITVLPAQAQSGGATTIHADLRWNGYAAVPSRSARKQRVPTFQGAYHEVDEQAGVFSLRLNGAVNQGEITNAVFEPFAAADARLFNASRLPAGLVPALNQGVEMKRTITYLSLKAVRRNPQTGQPERLVSFDYSYSLGSSTLAARGTLANRTHAETSVLNSGDWYKVGVAESGVYKLDRAALDAMGFNTASVNPAQVKLYGNAMGVLPQPNASWRPDDLMENAVRFVGDGDNVFDAGEYFLFYSPGAHTWEVQNGMFRHRNNIYTDTTYYFVTVGGAGSRPGRRVATVPMPAASTTTLISTFTDRYFHEHDLVNLLHSGRQWLGEGFSNGSQQRITFANLPDLVIGAPVKVLTSVAASSMTSSVFQFTLNGAALSSQPLLPLDSHDFAEVAKTSTTIHNLNLPAATGTDLAFNLTYSSADPTSSGYLDYLDVNVQRQLRLSGPQLEFRSLQNLGPQAMNRYALTNAAGATVWDVTDPRNPRQQTINPNSGEFIAAGDSLREFVALQEAGSFSTPRRFGRVANQNLHALGVGGTLDLVIVTYPAFKAQAQRLADHRFTHDGLRAAVVTTTQVYNEFSSGGQDVTAIRDLMKQVYDRAPAGKFMQLLLFGDASFDYKSDPTNPLPTDAVWPAWWRSRTPFKSTANFDAANQNFVPTYESRESFAPFYGGAFGQASYSSDDYYALLDDNEGEWAELIPGTEQLDIGVGRLPVRTPVGEPRSPEQARQVVNKIISYDAAPAYGKWRNRITLVSDDGNGDLFVGAGSELIANTIHSNAPVYNIHKLYLDLYPQLSVAAGQRSPELNRALDASIEQGSLIVNYLGHGGPKGWADEQIVTNGSVLALQNTNNLTFMVTGTCDFSTYDNPDFTSAGEQAFTDNERGGVVGLFTTTRVVDAGQNAGLNQAFYNRVFQPVNGKMPTIGTVVMLSKNSFPGPGLTGVINNRNYTLLADPSMTLAYPEQEVVLDSVVNLAGMPLSTLRALERVRLHGKVLNNGALNAGFNGTAQVTIFDKPTTVTTLGDEANGDPLSGDRPRPVTIQENVIFGGQATVSNGQFSVTFMVPKDINYNIGQGKVSLYASDPNNLRRGDAHGYQLTPVGGALPGAPGDSLPPRIRLYMDNTSFVFGGLTAQNTTLLAYLSDESGINTTGAGIGHEITATLDHDPTKLIVLNDTYVSEVNNFQAGKVNYLFKDLSAGPHSLRVKAWDTHNNSAEQEIEFVVANKEELALDHVLNYPNPFANTTAFHFDHNRAGEDLDVQVQIFTVAGKLVRTLTASVSGLEAGSHQKSISWNGRDEYDEQLARGVYVYRLSVRCGESTASKFEKLVILN